MSLGAVYHIVIIFSWLTMEEVHGELIGAENTGCGVVIVSSRTGLSTNRMYYIYTTIILIYLLWINYHLFKITFDKMVKAWNLLWVVVKMFCLHVNLKS